MPLCPKSHVPVGIQPLVDDSRTLLGVHGMRPKTGDRDYLEAMLVSLNSYSYTVRAPCHCHPNGVQIHAGRDFGVTAIGTGKGAVRFLFVCMGCDCRAMRLYVNRTGEPIPRCRRCLRLRYETLTTRVRSLERTFLGVFGTPPWMSGGDPKRQEPPPLGTPVAPTRNLQLPGAPRPEWVLPATPSAAGAAHAAANSNVNFAGPPRDLAEVARRFDEMLGPGSWQAAAAANAAASPPDPRLPQR